MTHLSTPDLIRALGGADAICKPGCSCRGSYTGPERRSVARHGRLIVTSTVGMTNEELGWIGPIEQGQRPGSSVGRAPFDGFPTDGSRGFESRYGLPAPGCPAEGCELFGPHDLHRDSEGFTWRQVTA